MSFITRKSHINSSTEDQVYAPRGENFYQQLSSVKKANLEKKTHFVASDKLSSFSEQNVEKRQSCRQQPSHTSYQVKGHDAKMALVFSQMSEVKEEESLSDISIDFSKTEKTFELYDALVGEVKELTQRLYALQNAKMQAEGAELEKLPKTSENNLRFIQNEMRKILSSLNATSFKDALNKIEHHFNEIDEEMNSLYDELEKALEKLEQEKGHYIERKKHIPNQLNNYFNSLKAALKKAKEEDEFYTNIYYCLSCELESKDMEKLDSFASAIDAELAKRPSYHSFLEGKDSLPQKTDEIKDKFFRLFNIYSSLENLHSKYKDFKSGRKSVSSLDDEELKKNIVELEKFLKDNNVKSFSKLIFELSISRMKSDFEEIDAKTQIFLATLPNSDKGYVIPSDMSELFDDLFEKRQAVILCIENLKEKLKHITIKELKELDGVLQSFIADWGLRSNLESYQE